ncbi:hypothetical protein PMAYCL1PPCAC_09985, partial [Pristionchus mayeri]
FQMRVLVFFSLLVAFTSAVEMQKQCLCSDLNPCIASVPKAIEDCGEKCKAHVTELGADYPAVRKCVLDQQDDIQKAVDCVRAAFGDEVCASKPGQEIPRRFAETMQLAATREMNEGLKKSHLVDEAVPLINHAKKAMGCWIKCGQSHSCAKKLDCGVKLPSDNEIIKVVKKCAIDAGFNTKRAKEICECLAHAGIKQLTPMCPKIIVS